MDCEALIPCERANFLLETDILDVGHIYFKCVRAEAAAEASKPLALSISLI